VLRPKITGNDRWGERKKSSREKPVIIENRESDLLNSFSIAEGVGHGRVERAKRKLNRKHVQNDGVPAQCRKEITAWRRGKGTKKHEETARARQKEEPRGVKRDQSGGGGGMKKIDKKVSAPNSQPFGEEPPGLPR